MFDTELLKQAINTTMPFGKYAGRKLIELPEPYLVWFQQKGFPDGKLGDLLRSMLEIKTNSLESIIRKIQKHFPKETR